MTPMLLLFLLVPSALQAAAMSVDEGYFHRRRGLPTWERIGHPLDTLTAAACFALLAFAPRSTSALYTYIALSAFSCLFITKDEFVHAKHCAPSEGWLHAVLFVLHPIVFFAFGVLWWFGAHPFILRAELALTLSFLLYQVVYWSFIWRPPFIRNRL